MKRMLTFLLGTFFLLLPCLVQSAEWYRGNTHSHSWWSDGNVPPEEAVNWYKTHGYQFLSLTDHTYLQTDTNRWRAATDEVIERLKKQFGDDWVEVRDGEKDGKKIKEIRLKTVDELQKKFNEPGKFLLVPGHEQNAGVDGRTLHTIAFNVSETIPFQGGESASESIMENLWAVKRNGEKSGRSTLMIVNHPAWPFYDIPPHSMIHAPKAQFFEFLCGNGGVSGNSTVMDDKFWNRENYWDIISAFRTINGDPLAYGVGADDTHNYTDFGARRDNPGEAFIVVRADQLTAGALVAAMRKGDFYVSTGVELADVRFDNEAKTLHVSAKPVEGVKYTIEFIGTKKDFDRTVTSFTVEKGEKNPAQRGYRYDFDQIGVSLKKVEGATASYTMAPDDLYVRAIITSDKPNAIQAGYEPETDSAWTQPYR